MVKRIIVICFSVMLVLLVAGCHEAEKRAGSIYQSLEKSAAIEKNFAEKQQTSVKAGQNEQALYNEIISLEIDQEQQIKQNMTDAQQLNEKQEHYLQEAKDCFHKAYEASSHIKTAAQNIDDTNEKRKATAVVQLMEKRQNLFESYYNQYLDVLKLNSHLYEQLQSKELKASNLDKQVKKINQSYKMMKEQEQEFNQITEHYNQVKSQYYKNSSLTQKRINQMEENRAENVSA